MPLVLPMVNCVLGIPFLNFDMARPILSVEPETVDELRLSVAQYT